MTRPVNDYYMLQHDRGDHDWCWLCKPNGDIEVVGSSSREAILLRHLKILYTQLGRGHEYDQLCAELGYEEI